MFAEKTKGMKTCPFCWSDNDDDLAVCQCCRKELTAPNQKPGGEPTTSRRQPPAKLTRDQFELLAKVRKETKHRRMVEGVLGDSRKEGLQRLRWGGIGVILVTLFLASSSPYGLEYLFLPIMFLPFYVCGVGVYQWYQARVGKLLREEEQPQRLINEAGGSLFWLCMGIAMVNVLSILSFLLLGPPGVGGFLLLLCGFMALWRKV